MEDPPSLLVDSNSPWQIPYSPLISEEPHNTGYVKLWLGRGAREGSLLSIPVHTILLLAWCESPGGLQPGIVGLDSRVGRPTGLERCVQFVA